MNCFQEFIIDKYDLQELQDIAKHGCENVAPHGMITYIETKNLYDNYAIDLHAILAHYKEEFGEYPNSVLECLGCGILFYNSVVWFCAEYVAQGFVE
jgi:trehalose-6-phosphatase